MSFHELLRKHGVIPAPTPVIMVGDFGKDLDDEQALMLLLGLQRAGLVDVRAVIGCLNPAMMRARQAKGICIELGFPNIPVGVGSDITDKEMAFDHETADYMADESLLIENGAVLLVRTLEAAENESVVLFLCAGMTDAANLFNSHLDLVLQKVDRVVIMGGVKLKKYEGGDGDDVETIEVCRDRNGFMTPDDAANNEFDKNSAGIVYKFCQEHGLEMTILMREAAYACQFPLGTLYTDLGNTGSVLGERLVKVQAPGLRVLWRQCNEPKGSKLRSTLPLRCNRKWFIETYCLGTDPGDVEDIWPHVCAGQLCDPMAALCVVHELKEHFFFPFEMMVNEVFHDVIGLDRVFETGIRDPNNLRSFISGLLQITLEG